MHTAPITMDGRQLTFNAWCAELGAFPSIVEQRMREGWSFPDAILTPTKLRKDTPDPHIRIGNALLPVCEAARRARMPAELVMSRIERGWSFTAALSVPVLRRAMGE